MFETLLLTLFVILNFLKDETNVSFLTLREIHSKM